MELWGRYVCFPGLAEAIRYRPRKEELPVAVGSPCSPAAAGAGASPVGCAGCSPVAPVRPIGQSVLRGWQARVCWGCLCRRGLASVWCSQLACEPSGVWGFALKLWAPFSLQHSTWLRLKGSSSCVSYQTYRGGDINLCI